MKKLLVYALLFLLLLSPLLAYFYATYFNLPGSFLPAYTSVLFFFGLFFIITQKNLRYPKFIWFLLIYAIYRLVWLQFADLDYSTLSIFYEAILNFTIFFIIVIIYNTRFSDNFIRNSIFIIKVTVVLAAIVSIIQVFNQDFLNPWEYWGYDVMRTASLYEMRRTSIFGFVDPNELGLSYIPLASLLIGFLLIKKSRQYIIFTILVGITAFLSNARYVMIGFIILTMQYLLFFKVKGAVVARYTVQVFFIVFIVYCALTYLGYEIDKFYSERLFPEGSFTQTSRYKAWENFLIFFPRYMFFGTGVHLTEEIRAASLAVGSSQIHVGYLSHLVSYGLVGSFLLFGFWFMLAKHLYKNAKRTNYWGSFFAFLVFFWAQATLVKYSILFTGLIFALIFDKYTQDKYLNNGVRLNEKR